MKRDRESFFDAVNEQLNKADRQAAAGDRDAAVKTAIDAAQEMLRRVRKLEMHLDRKVDRVL